FIGEKSSDSSIPSTGKFYRAQVFNGIDGAKVFDMSTSAAQPLVNGTSTFNALTGQTVTIKSTTGSGLYVSPISVGSGITAQNTHKLLSTNSKLKAFTLSAWTVPALTVEWDNGSQGQSSIPIVTTSPGGAGIYYNKDKFIAIVESEGTAYTATAFAPDPHRRYAVDLVMMGEAFYLVVNGVPGDIVQLDGLLSPTVEQTELVVGSAGVQHVCIFPYAQTMEQIRKRVAVGSEPSPILDFMTADSGQIFTFDIDHANTVLDDYVTLQDWDLADKRNMYTNIFGRMQLPEVPALQSLTASGTTGSTYSATGYGYQFVGTTGAGTNNFIKVEDVTSVLSSQGALGGSFTFAAGITATIMSIFTPSRGEETILSVNSA
ncbi:MAG TPA: hypothetical protein VFM18_19825, partial [Methanosarcina sp.]|nr:hypothetical protein [Methanosarcina sp.]